MSTSSSVVDGFACAEWTVPKTLEEGVSFVIVCHAAALGSAKAECRSAGEVHVTPPLRMTRVGLCEVELSWGASAAPPGSVYLSLSVTPTDGGEAAVTELFCAAAASNQARVVLLC